jgi:hypothetical protein
MYGEFATLIVENRHLLTQAEALEALDSKGRFLYIAWLENSNGANKRGAGKAEKLMSMVMEQLREMQSKQSERQGKEISEL